MGGGQNISLFFMLYLTIYLNQTTIKESDSKKPKSNGENELILQLIRQQCYTTCQDCSSDPKGICTKYNIVNCRRFKC